LAYDYMASHNYISPNPYNFAEGYYDPGNVNYDTLITNGGSSTPVEAQNWASTGRQTSPTFSTIRALRSLS
jgi:hypothetical protein